MSLIYVKHMILVNEFVLFVDLGVGLPFEVLLYMMEE